MLYCYIGNTGKAQTNVITFGYTIEKFAEDSDIEFTIAYCANIDRYQKSKAKEVIQSRFTNGDTYKFTIDRMDNIKESLLSQLESIHDLEYFREDCKFVYHPIWAIKLIQKLNSFVLNK